MRPLAQQRRVELLAFGHELHPLDRRLAAGAIIGGALAGPSWGYGYYDPYPYGYYGGYGGAYAYGGCYRQRIWTPYGWRFRRVCY